MAIKILKGNHITKLDRKVITAVIKAGETQGRTPRKGYKLQKTGANIFIVVISTTEQGKPCRQCVTIQVTETPCSETC